MGYTAFLIIQLITKGITTTMFTNLFAGFFFLTLGLLFIYKPEVFLTLENFLNDILQQERRYEQFIRDKEKHTYRKVGRWFIGFAIFILLIFSIQLVSNLS